eukprot:SAG31_NODE_41029_length_278_cov_0.575419_1_plen_68_part_01
MPTYMAEIAACIGVLTGFVESWWSLLRHCHTHHIDGCGSRVSSAAWAESFKVAFSSFGFRIVSRKVIT